MKTTGFYWHVHHDILLEYCYDAQERTDFILENKPESERALRLRLFQPVKGKLPKAVVKAHIALDKARIAQDKARITWEKAYIAMQTNKGRGAAAVNRTYIAWEKACIALNKAEIALDKAVADNMPAIEALHAKECPDCPWNGRTIFEE